MFVPECHGLFRFRVHPNVRMPTQEMRKESKDVYHHHILTQSNTQPTLSSVTANTRLRSLRSLWR